jgi:hypothetical protein
MNARVLLASAGLIGLFAATGAGGEARQPPPLVYELTIDGRTFEVKDSTPVEITVQGRSVETAIRIKPIQHYAIDGLEFDYDKSLALQDDFDKQGRTVNLTHGSTVSIVVTDFGPSGADGPRTTLADIAAEMENRIKRGVCKDLRKTFAVPASFKRARGYTTTLTYKDEDDDEQVCRMVALDSRGRRFTVIVQYDSTEKELSESLAKITLESITGR